MMDESYKDPFNPDDFRGYFTWESALSLSLSTSLYHACHKTELATFLKKKCLPLRSKWAIALPTLGVCNVPGVWAGLNHYSNGNHYGPFLIEFPLRVLDDRRFMAFRRKGAERPRYVFVQYEAMIPIFSFKGKTWRKIKPHKYFKSKDCLELKPNAIYDVVLTEPLTFDQAIGIEGVKHPKCIPGQCAGMKAGEARKAIVEIATKEFQRSLVPARLPFMHATH